LAGRRPGSVINSLSNKALYDLTKWFPRAYDIDISKSAGTNSWLTERMHNMATPVIDLPFITPKSGVRGIVKEIVETSTGYKRVRLDVNGETRWTTVKA
jgi:hypothetical protein